MPASISLRAAAALSLVAGLFAPPRSEAQPAPSAPPEFETATVKPSGERSGVFVSSSSTGSSRRPIFAMAATHVQISYETLAGLIAYAFSLPVSRVAGPDWIDGPEAPRFDILARFPPGAYAQVPEMLQSLLADHFHLATHRGTREQPVDALVVANGGLKLKPARPDTNNFADIAGQAGDAALPGTITHIAGMQTATTTTVGADRTLHTQTWTNDRLGTAWVASQAGTGRQEIHLEAPNTSMAGLAGLLVAVAQLPDIADMTQTEGRYQVDMKVTFSETALVSPDVVMQRKGPQSTAAIMREWTAYLDARRKTFNRELLKLGLQLEHRTAPVDVVIVDRVDQSPTAN